MCYELINHWSIGINFNWHKHAITPPPIYFNSTNFRQKWNIEDVWKVLNETKTDSYPLLRWTAFSTTSYFNPYANFVCFYCCVWGKIWNVFLGRPQKKCHVCMCGCERVRDTFDFIFNAFFSWFNEFYSIFKNLICFATFYHSRIHWAGFFTVFLSRLISSFVKINHVCIFIKHTLSHTIRMAKEMPHIKFVQIFLQMWCYFLILSVVLGPEI